MMILINGEIQSDAGSSVKGDTVLIFYRSVGFKYIYRSPPYSERQFRRKLRAGCEFPVSLMAPIMNATFPPCCIILGQ